MNKVLKRIALERSIKWPTTRYRTREAMHTLRAVFRVFVTASAVSSQKIEVKGVQQPTVQTS